MLSEDNLLSKKTDLEYDLPIKNRNIDEQRIEKLYKHYKAPLNRPEDVVFNYFVSNGEANGPALFDLLEKYVRTYGKSAELVFSPTSTLPIAAKLAFLTKFNANMPYEIANSSIKCILDSKDAFLRENKINEISIDHSSEAGVCRAELAKQRSRLSVLENQIISTLALLNNGTELTSLKARCKQIRADMKSIRYSLADLAHETMRILDQEKGIVIPDDEGGESGGDDVATDEYALLTETGLNILTEDGLIIIADVLSTPSNALLTETGVTILTEDGLIILLDGVTTEEAVKDAILNELGVAILTEDGRILLKG